jgi:hypothetical protein
VVHYTDDPRSRVYVEVADMDGDDVTLRGDTDDLVEDADSLVTELLADHDVTRYPEGAIIGWFAPHDPRGGTIRAPGEVETDPYPFDNV